MAITLRFPPSRDTGPIFSLEGGYLSYPYYRFFPGDYLRDTRRLTMMQHGAYHLLIHEYMTSGGPLKGDVDAMCRICGALSGEERTAVEFCLAEFFIRDGPLWRHKRCDAELDKLAERSAAAAESAKARWDANALRTHCDGNANQKLEPEVRTRITKVKSIVRQKPDVAPPKEKTQGQKRSTEDAATVLQFLNVKTGKHFRPVPANVRLILTRLEEGFTVQDCKSVIAKKVREWKGDDRMNDYLRPKTLFNRTNFANYEGELYREDEDNG